MKNKYKIKIMTFNKNNTRGGQTYETPSVEILDVMSEGVFCISTQDMDAADWQKGNYEWFE